MAPHAPLIAVDIGNSRIKCGWFAGDRDETGLPFPARVLELAATSFEPASLEEWLRALDQQPDKTMQWWIASVNRAPTERLAAWLRERVGEESDAEAQARLCASSQSSKGGGYCLLKHTDLPLAVPLAEPGRVGIDRLLGAVAANHLRADDRAAVVIDVGSAITVDVVSSEGAFLGGAILPGIGMAARAMHDFTDKLPLVAMDELTDPPPALGDSTVAAMRSGLYWGAVGAMRELIIRLAATLHENREPHEILLTGGAAPMVARYFDARARYVPHLILAGIALVAQE